MSARSAGAGFIYHLAVGGAVLAAHVVVLFMLTRGIPVSPESPPVMEGVLVSPSLPAISHEPDLSQEKQPSPASPTQLVQKLVAVEQQAAPATPAMLHDDVSSSTSELVQKPVEVSSATSAASPAANTERNTGEPIADQLVQLPRSDAAGLDNPPPAYPSLSRRLGEQGRVLLDVHILESGKVGEVRLRTSSGFRRLDEAAQQTVKGWRYLPARRGGEAIAFWYVQPISFYLNR